MKQGKSGSSYQRVGDCGVGDGLLFATISVSRRDALSPSRDLVMNRRVLSVTRPCARESPCRSLKGVWPPSTFYPGLTSGAIVCRRCARLGNCGVERPWQKCCTAGDVSDRRG